MGMMGKQFYVRVTLTSAATLSSQVWEWEGNLKLSSLDVAIYAVQDMWVAISTVFYPILRTTMLNKPFLMWHFSVQTHLRPHFFVCFSLFDSPREVSFLARVICNGGTLSHDTSTPTMHTELQAREAWINADVVLTMIGDPINVHNVITGTICAIFSVGSSLSFDTKTTCDKRRLH